MVFRIGPDNTEVFTLETNVNREISVSQDGTLSGSLYVIPKRMDGLKELNPSLYNTASFAGDTHANNNLVFLKNEIGDKAALVQDYMKRVGELSRISKFNSTASVFLFKTPTEYNADAARRFLIQRTLEQNPVRFAQESNWSTTNYNCLNFFTSSDTHVSSVLIYPNSVVYHPPNGNNDLDESFIAINQPITGTYSTASFSQGYSVATAYQLYDQFTIDFWIKPKYNADASTLWGWGGKLPYYRPGAIMHMSSAYAITLHSGSTTDKSGYADSFKICFQLGKDAEISPDQIPYGTDNFGTVTASTFWISNSLPLNSWSHVAITYGGYANNQGTGSIWINGIKDRDIPIGLFVPVGTSSLNFWPDSPLYVGNYYEGLPQQESYNPFLTSSYYNQHRFYTRQFGGPYIGMGPGDFENRVKYFNTSLNKKGFGGSMQPGLSNQNYYAIFQNPSFVGPNYPGVFPWDEPLNHIFQYPLNAELHDIRIWAKNLTKEKIQELQTQSCNQKDIQNLRFWVPPFFVEESIPKFNEPVTPFYSFGTSFDDIPVSSSVPIAAHLALSVNGFYPNLENYVTDLITDNPPVLWHLRWAQQITGSTPDYTANRWIYEELDTYQDSKKRLYTILPCDHGNYKPSFNMIENLGFSTKSFVNEYQSKTLGRVNLKNLMYYSNYTVDDILNNDVEINSSIVGLSSNTMTTQNAEKFLLTHNDNITSSLINDIVKARPENTTAPQGFGFAVWQRLQSPDSHFVSIFDISNLYYGESIKPGSVELYTTYMSGSDGAIGMKLKDNGRGGLYRAESDGEHAVWSTVGSVLYDEGIIVIKYPQLYFFGDLGWTLKFKGTRNVYVYTIETVAYPMTCIESSDPNYKNIQLPDKVDYDPSEEDRTQVFIGSVLIHDENMNVIMRTTLAQPIVKRSSDKLLFKTKIDF